MLFINVSYQRWLRFSNRNAVFGPVFRKPCMLRAPCRQHYTCTRAHFLGASSCRTAVRFRSADYFGCVPYCSAYKVKTLTDKSWRIQNMISKRGREMKYFTVMYWRLPVARLQELKSSQHKRSRSLFLHTTL